MQIALHALRFHAFHGCLPQERVVGGDYEVDVALDLPDTPAATERDELSGTVNYAEVYALVEREMQQPSNLIEHVAGRILTALFAQFPPVAAATVRVCKLNPPIGTQCRGASVTLRRARNHSNPSTQS